MKVLVSREAGRGGRGADSHHTTDGELVGLPVVICESPEGRAECGCGHSFTGFDTRKTATVAVVEESPLDEREIRYAAFDSAVDGEWGGPAAAIWAEEVLGLYALARKYPPGSRLRVKADGTDVNLVPVVVPGEVPA